MKNLLRLLAVAVLGSTTVVPNITLNNMLINTLNNRLIKQYNNDINLSITQIIQERGIYCVSANVQMIFTFFGVSLDHFSQSAIFQQLDGNEHGIIVDEHVANYLNTHIPTETHYGANHISGYNFGANIQEQWAFQNYVYQSLSHNHPVILAFNIPGHAILITGIAPNATNPELTRYFYSDPAVPEGSERPHFFGSQLPIILRDGGDIVGEGEDPELQRQDIQVGINNREVGANWLNDSEDHEVARIRTDLTATIGSTTTGKFAQTIDRILLPIFKGEIYLFSWRKLVDNFYILTDAIPRNNDNWISSKYTIANVHEDVGSAHIEGRILGQIQFERTESLKHLLMYLVIYVGGISWSTSNWAHVWFLTGNLLEFSKR